MRGHPGKTGAQHPCWKGGSRIDAEGYVLTYAPDHPWPRRGGYIREHIRVMELHIGRRLAVNEMVHHRDHDRTHNLLGNLKLMTRSEHSKLHRAEDKHLARRDAGGKYASA